MCMLGVGDGVDLLFFKNLVKFGLQMRFKYFEIFVDQDFGVELIWEFVYEENKNNIIIRLIGICIYK